MYEFKFPDVGEGITEGEIVKWLVKEGDSVTQDQPIAQVETDKAIVTIPSPVSGTISKLHHKEGDTINVGEVIISISEKGEKISTKPQEKQQEKKKSFGVVGELPEAEDIVTPMTSIQPKKQEYSEETKILATPATRRLAREFNIDLSKIKGSGVNGRITEEDIRKIHESSTKEEKKTEITHVRKYDEYGHIEHIPLKGVRKSVARHMRESLDAAAHVTHMDFIDVTLLGKIREKEKKKAEKKKIKLTFLPFVMKAVIAAMKEGHDYLNASLDDEHEEIILKKYYNIGFAVDTEDGLMVPVIKGADEKSILDMAKEIEDLAEKARKRILDLQDMKGGTFTITNVGSLGGVFATPIINHPESAILALGKIMDTPVVINDKIKIRKMLPVSLSFDHRILDGAEAARFVNDLKEHIEDPDLLLIERD